MNVKAVRRQLGLTQEELADLLPTTIRTISRWETDAFKPNLMARARLRAIVKDWQQRQHGHQDAPTPRRQLTAEDDRPQRGGVGVLPSMSDP